MNVEHHNSDCSSALIKLSHDRRYAFAAALTCCCCSCDWSLPSVSRCASCFFSRSFMSPSCRFLNTTKTPHTVWNIYTLCKYLLNCFCGWPLGTMVDNTLGNPVKATGNSAPWHAGKFWHHQEKPGKLSGFFSPTCDHHVYGLLLVTGEWH